LRRESDRVPRRFADVAEDERGERRGLRTRRGVMALLTLVPLVALTGVIGQRATVTRAAGAQAAIAFRAPRTVRGGLFFQSRVTISVRGRIQRPRLVLDPGWLEGMQLNSIEPQAQAETSRNGRLVLAYSTLMPGDHVELWLQFQVNPTNVGRRSYALELDDETVRVARVERNVTVLP
jgi:hypothetical protein